MAMECSDMPNVWVDFWKCLQQSLSSIDLLCKKSHCGASI